MCTGSSTEETSKGAYSLIRVCRTERNRKKNRREQSNNIGVNVFSL